MEKALTGPRATLRSKSGWDARRDYFWQSDPELCHLDATLPLTVAFTEYLSAYAQELNSLCGRGIYLAIETNYGKHIGNIACFNINEADSRAEIGIIIGERSFWNQGYGTEVINLFLSYVFETTSLNYIVLKTLAINHRAQKCFQKCGFRPAGFLRQDNYDFLLMETSRSWLTSSQAVKSERPDFSTAAGLNGTESGLAITLGSENA